MLQIQLHVGFDFPNPISAQQEQYPISAQTVALYSSWATWSSFHLMCASFLCMSFDSCYFFIHVRLLPHFLDFPYLGMKHSEACRRSLKISQLFQTLFSSELYLTEFSQADTQPEKVSPELQGHGPAFSFIPSLQNPELQHFMVTAAKTALTLTTQPVPLCF